MNNKSGLSALNDELSQVRKKKKEFLAQIERIIPWVEWLALIKPCYYKGERGNNPNPQEMMLRLYLLQNLYNLSDEGTVAEAIDSRAFSEFCGVDSSNQDPDGDSLGRFRNLLIKSDMQERLFGQVVEHLQRKVSSSRRDQSWILRWWKRYLRPRIVKHSETRTSIRQKGEPVALRI